MSFFINIFNRQKFTRQATFALSDAASIQIRIPNGDIEIHTHDDPSVHAELKAYGVNAEAQLAGLEITFDEASATLHIVHPSNRGITFHAIDMIIRAPRFQRIAIQTTGGDSRITAPCHELVVRSTAGDIACKAPCSALMQLESTAGDIDVDYAAARTEIRSTAGDVEVKVTQPAHVSVRTTAGDIDVEVARGFETQIDAQTLAGDIDNDIEITTGADGDGTPAQVVLSLEALSGDISIDRM